MRAALASLRARAKPVHPYQWLWEPLLADRGVELRRMFGGHSAYIDGRLCLFFVAKTEPWRGLFVCTERDHHAALAAEFPLLSPHPVLPKWLYLSESHDAFERIAKKLVEAARRRDPRIGIIPPAKKKRRPRPHGLPGHP